MTIGYFTDCEDCENYENEDECLGCVHYDDWVDKFVPISSGKKAERANEQKREFLSKMMKDEVFMNLTPEFADRLKLAWKFVPKVEKENDKFYCVYCIKGYLMSVDGFRMAKIEAECPDELIGKHIVWDDLENKIYSRPADHVTPLSDGRGQELLNKAIGYEIKGIKSEIPFSDVNPGGERDKWHDIRLCGLIRLNREYVSDVLETIPDDEEIIVSYKCKEDPIRIKALGIDALILPIRE